MGGTGTNTSSVTVTTLLFPRGRRFGELSRQVAELNLPPRGRAAQPVSLPKWGNQPGPRLTPGV